MKQPLETQFKTFLKKRRMYSAFMRNMKIYGRHKSIKQLCKTSTSPYLYFIEAFRASRTPEGMKKWGGIKREWINQL